jgi:8-oxo-dGTP pyrophosphatase MutT (NUDIX family)
VSEPVEVRHAATVVVVRGDGADAEVLLLRRGDTAGFMAGMFVYPGGRLDPADLDAAAGDLDTAARWTALRECFEESGLLLATDHLGQPATPDHVAALRSSNAPFAEALQALALRPGLQTLRPFARWVTPAVERRRFDTRFYLAPHPDGQEAEADGFEMVEHRWRRPTDALQEYASSSMLLSPPTFYFLADLAEQLDAGIPLHDWADAQPLHPVLPRLELTDAPRLLLPGDADYPSEQPVSGPTRMLLVDGRWQRHTVRRGL